MEFVPSPHVPADFKLKGHSRGSASFSSSLFSRLMEDEDDILWTCVCRFCSSTTETWTRSTQDDIKRRRKDKEHNQAIFVFLSPFSACSMICLRAFFRLLALSISCSLDRYVLPSEPDSPLLSTGLEPPLSWLGTEPAGTTWTWRKRKHNICKIHPGIFLLNYLFI